MIQASKEHSTFNIELSTLSASPIAFLWMFNVECWLLNVPDWFTA